jgi:hypothetical protein
MPSKTVAQIQKETKRLAKLTAKARSYPHHSAKRHYFKAQAQKVRGRLAQLKDLLRKQHKSGPKAAVRWATHQIGTTESPPYSNLGPGISTWERNTGYNVPPGVFWCGCFASEAVIVHGKAQIPNRNRCGYGPYVMDDAARGRNGFRKVPFDQARPGDYLIFFNGEHQGIARSAAKGDSIDTIEGNTSPSSAGSQFNGGCVAAKTRHRSDVSCVARPNYQLDI